MHWQDEGFLLSKNNFNENSIIIEVFTLNHGKYSGIVYGGSSRKQKKNFQIGNRISLNWISKGQNKNGYFNVELVDPITPYFFDDKKKIACIISSSSILKILLPERQINKSIFYSYEAMLNNLYKLNWINKYIFWELDLIKNLGYEVNFRETNLKIPNFFLKEKNSNFTSKDIKEALIFNKNLLLNNFITPNKLRFPLFRDILEKYYN